VRASLLFFCRCNLHFATFLENLQGNFPKKLSGNLHGNLSGKPSAATFTGNFQLQTLRKPSQQSFRKPLANFVETFTAKFPETFGKLSKIFSNLSGNLLPQPQMKTLSCNFPTTLSCNFPTTLSCNFPSTL